MCLPVCLKATQRWCAAYSDLSKNINELLLVQLTDDVSLEILSEL